MSAGAKQLEPVVSQAEAEAGTVTDERVWTAQRVNQAISALGGGGGGSSTYAGAHVYRTTSQTVTTTQTVVTFSAGNSAEWFDTDSYHDTVTNNDRLTIPSGLAGKYLVTAGYGHNAASFNFNSFVYIYHFNSSDVLQSIFRGNTHANAVVSSLGGCRVVGETNCAVGDYFQMRVKRGTELGESNFSPPLTGNYTKSFHMSCTRLLGQ